MKTFNTFKYYDNKDRRLSIFCESNNGVLKITVFPCSNDDSFSKKEAWKAFKSGKVYDVKPSVKSTWNGKNVETTYYPGIEKDIIKKELMVKGETQEDFIRWCNRNYRKELAYIIKIDSNKKIKKLRKRKNGDIELVLWD